MIVGDRDNRHGDKHRRQHQALADVPYAFVLATDVQHCHLFVHKASIPIPARLLQIKSK